jgi:hypothetical protein
MTRNGRTRRTALIYLLLILWGILSLRPFLLVPEILAVNLTYGKNDTKTQNCDKELTMCKVFVLTCFRKDLWLVKNVTKMENYDISLELTMC